MPGPYPVAGDHLREEIWIRIRNLLIVHWDPVGVRDEPLAADEYDAYIPRIQALLRRGTSVDELMDCLSEIETRSMGFTPQRERGRTAAEHLLPLASLLDQ